MKLLISAAIAFGILGVALIGTAPAQAANCDQVSSFAVKSFNFPTTDVIGLSVNTKLGAPAEVWTFERSDDNGGSYNVVQSSLTKSYSNGLSTTTAATRLRVSASGCSFVYDPNEAIPFEMRLVYGPF